MPSSNHGKKLLQASAPSATPPLPGQPFLTQQKLHGHYGPKPCAPCSLAMPLAQSYEDPSDNGPPHYQAHHQWHWRVTPQHQLLHQAPIHANPKVAVLIQTQCCYLTFLLLIPTNQVLHGTLVTPHDPQHCLVHLPLSDPPHPHTTVPTAAIPSLVVQFRAQLQLWQQPLYGVIRKHQKTTLLHELLAQKQTLTLVSDASVQKNKLKWLCMDHYP